MASITTPSHDSDVASGTSQPPPRLHAASSRVREPRSFTSGLFECSDPATCCRVACCWPVVTGELAQRVLFTRRKHVCFLIAGALWALLLLRAVRLIYRQAHGTAFDARIELLCGGVCGPKQADVARAAALTSTRCTMARAVTTWWRGLVS